jgi:hypothetical protein
MSKLFVGSMWLILVWVTFHVYKSDIMWSMYYDIESWAWTVSKLLNI